MTAGRDTAIKYAHQDVVSNSAAVATACNSSVIIATNNNNTTTIYSEEKRDLNVLENKPTKPEMCYVIVSCVKFTRDYIISSKSRIYIFNNKSKSDS